MSELTHVTLLDRVRETQAGASWADFVAIYDELIVGWLRRQGVTHADAEDIRQEVMQAVVSEIGRFEHNGRPGAFRRWLRQITANRMRRFWRRRDRRPVDAAGPDVEQIAEQLEDDRSRMTVAWEAEHDHHVLARLLDSLNGRFSQNSLSAFRRLAIADEPVRRVADDLGMTIGAARVAQHRVLRALKELAAGLTDG